MTGLTWIGARPHGTPNRRTLTLLWLCAAALTLALLAARAHGEKAAGEAIAAAGFALATAIVTLLWPALDPAAAGRPMAPLVALVGCDGSGKSTLSADLLADLTRERPVQACYLGLGSGVLGARIKAIPFVGARVERRLARKATQTRTRGQTIPGLATALVVYLFSLARLRRFRRMLALRRAGVAVIADRYPQTEVAGFYDGPGLSAAASGNRMVAALARAERRIYQWMASVRPDVVIRLNVDLETAFARKPDHAYDLLRRKVAATPNLRFAGARIVDIDSTATYETVRLQVRTVVRDALAAA